jgi:hypothetical protein
MIPPKIFGRMLDLVVADYANRECWRAMTELESLQDRYGWPANANDDQRCEWDRLHLRCDPNVVDESDEIQADTGTQK